MDFWTYSTVYDVMRREGLVDKHADLDAWHQELWEGPAPDLRFAKNLAKRWRGWAGRSPKVSPSDLDP